MKWNKVMEGKIKHLAQQTIFSFFSLTLDILECFTVCKILLMWVTVHREMNK